jgi:hypothetical protein
MLQQRRARDSARQKQTPAGKQQVLPMAILAQLAVAGNFVAG